MMRRPFYALLALMAIAPAPARPQAADVAPGDNLVTKGIPPIPGAIAEEARRYSQLRTAAFWDWHPTRREMLIGTRFGDAQQLHVVSFRAAPARSSPSSRTRSRARHISRRAASTS